MTAPYDDPNERPPSLAQLGGSRPMPTSLEDRVIRSLKARGALGGSGTPRGGRLGWIAAVLAAGLGFFLVGRYTAPGAEPAAPTEVRWMLLLYEDESFQAPAAGRENDYVEEYRAWAASVSGEGRLVDGAELPPGGSVLEPGGALVTKEITAAGAGRLAGYFVIAAPTLEKAGQIAATCPHLRHNGRIAIRPIGAS